MSLSFRCAEVAEMAALRQAGTMIARRELESTLAAIRPALALAKHPWWILGSAAVALHGADPREIWDVDVLLDRRDCEAVFANLGLMPKPGQPDGRFRSDLFQRWTGASLPVELFAGFHILENGNWSEIVPETRIGVTCAGADYTLPDRGELVAMLGRFGRPKDQLRIAALNRTSRSPSRSGSA